MFQWWHCRNTMATPSIPPGEVFLMCFHAGISTLESFLLTSCLLDVYQRFQLLSGAEEACWAHNPKVVGSKPTWAKWWSGDSGFESRAGFFVLLAQRQGAWLRFISHCFYFAHMLSVLFCGSEAFSPLGIVAQRLAPDYGCFTLLLFCGSKAFSPLNCRSSKLFVFQRWHFRNTMVTPSILPVEVFLIPNVLLPGISTWESFLLTSCHCHSRTIFWLLRTIYNNETIHQQSNLHRIPV